MTASPQSGNQDEVPVCRCGHAFERHLQPIGAADPCAGGTPGFCGCSGYRAAAAADQPGGCDGRESCEVQCCMDDRYAQPGNQPEWMRELGITRAEVAAQDAVDRAAATAVDHPSGGEADGPTEDDVVGTCDWGGCNGETVALRRDSRDGRWLSVCTRHRTKASVAVELVMRSGEHEFTDDELLDLQADLDHLERTDPDVAAAAASYDRVVERITGRTLPPPGTGGEADDGTTPDAELSAWKPNTDGIPAPWREGDCAGHDPDGHRTRWCYCRRNVLRYPSWPRGEAACTGEGRCAGELCWYTLPLVDGLIVAHSKAGTLDDCEGAGRPPLASPSAGQDATPLARVRALIAHTHDGHVTVAALRHALDGTPLPDGPDDIDRIAARITALQDTGQLRDGPWRVGQHYGIHVYEGDRPVATFHRPEDAAAAVEARAQVQRVESLIEDLADTARRHRHALDGSYDAGMRRGYSVAAESLRRALDGDR